MPIYSFIGDVLPDTTRVSSPKIRVELPGGVDLPAGTLDVQIIDNRVIGRYETSLVMSVEGLATARNAVQDVATSLCNVVAVAMGAWTVVTVDVCLDGGGAIAARFGNFRPDLAEEMKAFGISGDRILVATEGEGGYFLRLAMNDVNAGLMDIKFLKSRLFRAVESLRNHVCSDSSDLSPSDRWVLFRTRINIGREGIDLLKENAERHGDYSKLGPLTSKEIRECFREFSRILSAYLDWQLVLGPK